jgi:hypothetical protein
VKDHARACDAQVQRQDDAKGSHRRTSSRTRMRAATSSLSG